MHTVTERLDQVLAETAELANIRRRLGELDEERAALEARAERLLHGLADAAASVLRPELVFPVRPAPLVAFANPSITDRILNFLDEHPTGEFGATEIAAALGQSSESNVNTIRGTLSRLNAEGRVMKMAYGKYTALRAGVSPPTSVAGNES